MSIVNGFILGWSMGICHFNSLEGSKVTPCEGLKSSLTALRYPCVKLSRGLQPDCAGHDRWRSWNQRGIPVSLHAASHLPQGLNNWVGCTVVRTLSRVQPFATPWTVAHQAPLSVEFSRQESWSGLPCPSPRDLPDPGTETLSPALAGVFFTPEQPGLYYSPVVTRPLTQGEKTRATPLLMLPRNMESHMKDVRNQAFLKNSRRYQFIYSIQCEVWTHVSWSQPTPPSVP